MGLQPPTEGEVRFDGSPLRRSELPDASRIPSGCRFHPCCPLAFDRCPVDDPAELIKVGGGHGAACWLVGG
jgi:peptide/nickel transport system ATP-binding protein